jgi:hypothetical protein
MAQPFLEKLKVLVQQYLPEEPHLECKHFFSGAALYANGVICASLTPVGLAFKLPEDLCSELIECGAASHLRYFAKSPIKKGYALFSDYEGVSARDLAKYFETAVANVQSGTT